MHRGRETPVFFFFAVIRSNISNVSSDDFCNNLLIYTPSGITLVVLNGLMAT